MGKVYLSSNRDTNKICARRGSPDFFHFANILIEYTIIALEPVELHYKPIF